MTTQAIPVSEWMPLSRADLTAFDDYMTNIVMEYMSLGWVGKMSKKGHAVLRAPDGKTTTSVSRSSSRASSGTRARADLDRWKNSQPGKAFGITPDTPEPDYGQDFLAILERTYGDERAMTYIDGLKAQAAKPEDLKGRIAVITADDKPGRWVLLDNHLRTVFAWSRDLDEDAAHIFAYETFHGEAPPAPAPETPVFECAECHATFPSGKSLGGHVNGHKPKVRCEIEGCSWEGKYIEAHYNRKHPGWTTTPVTTPLDWTTPVAVIAEEEYDTADASPIAEAIEREVNRFGAADPLIAVQALVDEVRQAREDAKSIQNLSDLSTRLTQELATVTKERDDLQARLDLLRETLSL